MSGILKMPRMGETMDEGKLVAWLVQPGKAFKRGEPILEVETDKTIVEFPALGDGTLVESLVEIGEMVGVGTPIAKIDVGEGPDWVSDGSTRDQGTRDQGNSGEGTRGEDNSDESNNDTSDAAAVVETPAPGAAESISVNTASAVTAAVGTAGARQRVTPLARRIAKQANIDLTGIVGTGRRGRIERADVEAVSQTISQPSLHTMAHAIAGDLHTGYGIAWAEKGVESGAPVLFIHGFAADHSAWSGLQSQLARSGHRTIAVDLPSHGAAAQDADDISELTQPVIALAEQKMGWQPVNIVAHSMGALVAVAVAQAVPTASLTLIAPAGVGRTINTHFLDALINPVDVASVARALRCLTHGPNGLSDAAHETIFNTLVKGRIAGIARSLAGASGQQIDLRKELAEIAQDIPVSLLLGHRDQVVNWSESLEISPLICVHHFPDAGHMPHWEALPRVQTILERKVPK